MFAQLRCQAIDDDELARFGGGNVAAHEARVCHFHERQLRSSTVLKLAAVDTAGTSTKSKPGPFSARSMLRAGKSSVATSKARFVAMQAEHDQSALHAYQTIAAEFSARVRALTHEQLLRSTPCKGWTVADVIHHVTADHNDALGSRMASQAADKDPVGAWSAVAARYAAALGSRQDLADAAEPSVLNLALHNWDIAVALGTDATFTPETLRFVQGFADAAGDRIYTDGAFAKLDLDTTGYTTQDAVLVHFGRHPARWRHLDPADRTDLAALISLRVAATAEQRREAGRPEPTAGEVEEFAGALRTWVQQEQQHRTFYLVHLGQELIGMASMLAYRRMPKPGTAPGVWCYVGNLYVEARHRGAGVGQRLLTAMLDDAREWGAVRAVLSPSARSVPLYRRTGFGDADDLLVNPLGRSPLAGSTAPRPR